MRLHHTQVSMPSGGEGVARQFYRDALGLVEVDKPASLAGRGGCWFRSYDDGTGSAEIHLGVEDPFTPARRAHPAFIVESVDALERLAQRVVEHGFEVDWADRDTLESYVRCHCRDGFGNRVELLAPVL
jgi:catechol 2,3-dioxygenase-like lactoylglutathione lyase family enzyme